MDSKKWLRLLSGMVVAITIICGGNVMAEAEPNSYLSSYYPDYLIFSCSNKSNETVRFAIKVDHQIKAITKEIPQGQSDDLIWTTDDPNDEGFSLYVLQANEPNYEIASLEFDFNGRAFHDSGFYAKSFTGMGMQLGWWNEEKGQDKFVGWNTISHFGMNADYQIVKSLHTQNIHFTHVPEIKNNGKSITHCKGINLSVQYDPSFQG